MRLFVASERTLETLVLEGFAWGTRNVVGPFRFAFLNSIHLDLNTGALKKRNIANLQLPN